MFFSPAEMEMICVLHQGSFSETLKALRWSVDGITNPEKMAIAESVVKKLSQMKSGDAVSLAFESEK